MMDILIVEDEPLVAQRLLREVRTFFGARLGQAVHCDTLEDTVAALRNGRFELVLLDLNLHGQDGYSLLELAGLGQFNTIIVSAHAERALTAFDFGVLDFVAKPFSQARLVQAFQRHLDKQAAGPGRPRMLMVKRLGDLVLLPVDDISHIRADGHYTDIVMHDGATHFHDKSFDALLQQLDGGFLRVHRSYAVNLLHVVRLHVAAGGRYSLDTRYARDIPVSRTLYRAVKAALEAG